MISPIATFVFIRIPDQAEWTCHLFTPAIAEDIGLVVDAQEYTLEVCYYHYTIFYPRTMAIILIHHNYHCT